MLSLARVHRFVAPPAFLRAALGLALAWTLTDCSSPAPRQNDSGRAESAAARKEESQSKIRSRISRMPGPSQILEQARRQFSPLPAFAPAKVDNPISVEKIALGKRLFFDLRLSKPKDRSCATCHPPEAYGAAVVDLPSIDPHKIHLRKAPSVHNAVLHSSLYWDGRARDLEEQAEMALLSSAEMGFDDRSQVLERIQSIPNYSREFASVFSDGLTFTNVARAIAAFERQLLTRSKFDEFLRGDLGALNDRELHGLHLFMKNGCANCHNGPCLGGSTYQKLGVVKHWPTTDLGRHRVTKVEQDRYVFKVGSLRNVRETGPYLHDGSVDNLKEMVRLMSERQTEMSTFGVSEMESLLAFFSSLTGTIPQNLATSPFEPAD